MSTFTDTPLQLPPIAPLDDSLRAALLAALDDKT